MPSGRWSVLFGAIVALPLHTGALEYSFTVDNPTMWTRKWSATINWKRSKSELFEYACHEGDHSLRGMLSAKRAEEAGRR
jgi:hypothetical protein